MIAYLWVWLTGYLVVKLTGPKVESLLNAINDKNIQLWDVKRLTVDIMIVRLAARDFPRLRTLLWGHSIRVSILERHGFAFFLEKAWKRLFLFLGLIAFLGGVVYLASFVWFIQIEGNENIAKEQIYDIILGEGLKVGLPKTAVVSSEIEAALLREFRDLAWVGVNIRGVLVQIQVVERSMPDLETQRQGEVRADRDGLITEVLVFRGTPRVSPGATVKKGDVLISGDYYDARGRLQHGRAEGIVRARIWYEGFGEAALSKITQEKTGQSHVGYVLSVGDFHLNLRTNPPFSPVFFERDNWTPEIRGRVLPLGFSRLTFHEVEFRTESIGREQAHSLAEERAWANLEEQGVNPETVRHTRVDEYEIVDDHGVRVILSVELEEDIGQFVPLQ